MVDKIKLEVWDNVDDRQVVGITVNDELAFRGFVDGFTKYDGGGPGVKKATLTLLKENT